MSRRTLCLAALVAAFLPLTTVAETVTTDGAIKIINDPGGNVMQTIMRREELARSGKQVQIRGYCRSACTLYLSLPNACLGPRATVGFHAPHFPGTKVITPFIGQMMAPYFRGKVRDRWLSTWQYSTEMTKMSADDYRKLDPQMKVCPGGGGGRAKKKARNRT